MSREMFTKTDLTITSKLNYSDADSRPFVSIDITSIDGKTIDGNEDVFGKLIQYVPDIKATRGEETFDVKEALGATQNPVGDTDKAHISLLYSFAFSTDPETKAEQIERAKQQVDTEVELKISLTQFKVVTAAAALKDDETTVTTHADFVKAPTLGDARNTLVTIEMDAATQEKLRQISGDILDKPDFPGNTDRSGAVQPYHMSVAQAQLDEDILTATQGLTQG